LFSPIVIIGLAVLIGFDVALPRLPSPKDRVIVQSGGGIALARPQRWWRITSITASNVMIMAADRAVIRHDDYKFLNGSDCL
jgi:hypothetical protein